MGSLSPFSPTSWFPLVPWSLYLGRGLSPGELFRWNASDLVSPGCGLKNILPETVYMWDKVEGKAKQWDMMSACTLPRDSLNDSLSQGKGKCPGEMPGSMGKGCGEWS